MLATDKTKLRRFTISLELSADEEWKQLSASHQPPLSLKYDAEYAFLRFLDENKDQQLKLGIE